jgi:alanyl-tRNA synthetase
VKLEVDHAARSATRRNHSATHLLHWALRTVLGEHAQQKGSRVGPSELRFDFAHNKPLSREEIERIEDLVNTKILLNAPVVTEVLPIDEAKKRGAVAIFEEKYGDVVRVLTMTPDSVELCGGTHARARATSASSRSRASRGWPRACAASSPPRARTRSSTCASSRAPSTKRSAW